MSLFPLGILSAAAGGEPALIPDYELISTAFGNGSSGTIEFTSIPQTFRHLEIRWVAKNTVASNAIDIRINGITSGSYASHRLSGQNTTVFSSANVGQTRIIFAHGISPSSVANSFHAGVFNVIDYASSTKNTTIRAFHGQAESFGSVQLSSGLLINTSAVTSISFQTTSGAFTSASRYSLYGIKG